MRLRLTLLYGGLFLVSGIVLLAITYVLVQHSTRSVVLIKGGAPGNERHLSDRDTLDDPAAELPVPEDLRGESQQLLAQARRQRDTVLDQLLIQSGIALAIMSVISIALGWLVAGRLLRPLRTMAATTRRISHENLHERLAMTGRRDELSDLGDTIDELLARLEEAFDAQRRFVANASHELRTPLAMMRTSVDVATGKPGPVPAQVTALGTKIREGLDQADRLVDSFLNLARAQHGAGSDQATVSLGDAVSAALDARRDAIAEQHIRVERELGDAHVHGSGTLLARMVENVIDNAIRHNRRDGWMRVETRVRDGAAAIVVENGGPRLEQRDVDHLVQPFRRLGADRVGSENGVGLGLSIVASIAAAHRGRLELAALPEGGLRALIELPDAGGAAA